MVALMSISPILETGSGVALLALWQNWRAEWASYFASWQARLNKNDDALVTFDFSGKDHILVLRDGFELERVAKNNSGAGHELATALERAGLTGAELGASAQAAMVTRGFAELRRIGAAFGARPETLMGLSGLGDLLLTCSSVQSRNFAYGLALGRGEALTGRPLAEGVPTAAIAARITAEQAIDAPIIAAVAAILDGAVSINDAVAALMSRPLKSED